MSAVLERSKIEKKIKPKVLEKAVERIFLQNVSWETYNRLNEEQINVSGLHFFYNNGDLEIMVESYKHGNYSRYLEYIILELADIFEIDFVPAGSATFRKKNQAKGFEGDGSFYFKNSESVRGKVEIDLDTDPAPELVIEVDITHGSLKKFPIFAGLGVEEIWRFDGEEVRFYRLENEDYTEVAESICLPNVKSETVTELVFAAQELKRRDWLKLIHESIVKG